MIPKTISNVREICKKKCRFSDCFLLLARTANRTPTDTLIMTFTLHSQYAL